MWAINPDDMAPFEGQEEVSFPFSSPLSLLFLSLPFVPNYHVEIS
jgi:hypothetical protein